MTERIHPVLKSQIELDLKDYNLQQSFQEGGKQKQKVFDYYVDLAKKLPELMKVKSLEAEVAQTEKLKQTTKPKVKLDPGKDKETISIDPLQVEVKKEDEEMTIKREEKARQEELQTKKYMDYYKDDFDLDEFKTASATQDVMHQYGFTDNVISDYPAQDTSEKPTLDEFEYEEHDKTIIPEEHTRDEINFEAFSPLPVDMMREIRERQKKGRTIPPKMMEEFERILDTSDGLEQAEEEGHDIFTEIGPVPGSNCTDFLTAVRRRDIKSLVALCNHEQGRSLNGETALHISAILESPECIQDLIDQKINVNKQSESGTTALHMSAMRGDIRSLKILFKNGAQPNIEDDDGISPLHFAISSAVDVSVLNLMIDSGCSVNQQDHQGMSPLHIAAELGDPMILQFLIEKGAKVTTLTTDYETPLHLAALNGHVECLNTLLRCTHIHVDTKDKFGSSSLHLAVKKSHFDVARRLLERGADIHAKDASLSTPLHYAAMVGDARMCKLLIGHRSFVSEHNEEMWTPLHLAVQGGFLECVEILIRNGAFINARNEESVTPLMLSISQGYHSITKLLLAHGADANIPDCTNLTCLMAAIQYGDEDMALTILKVSQNHNVKTVDNISAFHMALEEGHYRVAHELLQRGVNINAETIEGFQPLHFAVSSASLEWTEKLIQMGANPNAVTQNGYTPLRIAQEQKLEAIEERLRQLGAVDLDLFSYIELQKKK